MGLLRRSIYAAKRTVQGWPPLYHALYSTLTFNRDRLSQVLSRNRYPSRFGGMWTDRDDFEEQIARKNANAQREEHLRKWRDDGYLIFPKAISEADIDALNHRIADLPNNSPKGLQVTLSDAPQGVLYDPDHISTHASARIVDCYYHFAEARKILFAEPIKSFLKDVLSAEPLLTQSLSFEYGSEQSLHQDTSFVIMTSPMKFVAAWVALEDVKPGSGALQYLPGSHLWGDFLFSGKFKHWDRERDGDVALQEWNVWLMREAEKHQTKPEYFHAKKGDVFLWHSGLAHGGSPITDENATRQSLVGHYCPMGVRPLYHFYKPGQRKIYSVDGNRYCSAYYK